MKQAIIDIGSNSMRLTVYEIMGEKFKILFREKSMAGLAGYVEEGRLSAEGIARACSGLLEFRERLAALDILNVAVFATASLRNICNQDEVLNQMERVTGITPEIITGKEEARLDFIGATRFYPMEQGLLADIGGGSTELVWFGKEGPRELLSIPVGSLALNTQFVSGLISTEKEQEKMLLLWKSPHLLC